MRMNPFNIFVSEKGIDFMNIYFQTKFNLIDLIVMRVGHVLKWTDIQMLRYIEMDIPDYQVDKWIYNLTLD